MTYSNDLVATILIDSPTRTTYLAMSHSPRPPRRSVIYVPAINQRAMSKIVDMDVDSVIFDLEDAVSPAKKNEARQLLAESFSAGGFGYREAVIRTNAIDSPDWRSDMSVVARCRPKAVLIPKVSSPEDLSIVASELYSAGVADGIHIWAMVETTAGLLGLDNIVAHGLSLAPRLDCLVVGTNDIAKETGVDPGDERRYLMPWLMHVVLVAKRHGVSVLDGVWNDFSDHAGFEAEARQSVRMGFDGKTLIHPSQTVPANLAFTPSSTLTPCRLATSTTCISQGMR
jgi:citrate lyase subunit beta / citryl-CoA lyase